MRRALLILFLLCSCGIPAQAIITAGGAGHLIAPPTREYANSGVQYTGKWGNFAGTAIGKHHFITAVHVGGGVGQAFVLRDKKYIAEACTVIPGTDLAVWRVAEELPFYAPLYAGKEEVGEEIVFYGWGGWRGRPYRVGNETRGWYWGKSDGSLSWGRNRVEAAVGMPGNNAVLVWAFDKSGGDKEATVAGGDSGGGVFLREDGVWKLAGVNYASGGEYCQNAAGKPVFMAALWDARGLYQNAGAGWKKIDTHAWEASPTLAFASRISPHIIEIRRIVSGRDQDEERYPLSLRLAVFLGGGVLLLGFIIGIAVLIRRRKNGA